MYFYTVNCHHVYFYTVTGWPVTGWPRVFFNCHSNRVATCIFKLSPVTVTSNREAMCIFILSPVTGWPRVFLNCHQ